MQINETLPRGLWFRATRWHQYPDVATIQLECDLPDTRAHLALYRLDWHPFNTHKNGPIGSPVLANRFFDVGETHEHSCMNHIGSVDQELMANFPLCAAPVAREFSIFHDALTRACAILNITNCDDIPPSLLQPELV